MGTEVSLKHQALVKGSFSFFAGAVVGGFVSFSVLDANRSTPPPTPPLSKKPTPRKALTDLVELDPTLTDAELATQLDQARFDSDWNRATAVGIVLRARAAQAEPTDPGTSPAQPEHPVVTGRTSLVSLDREHQREVLLRDLAARDNRARREAEAEGSPAERERRLTQLFLLPPTQSDDVAVRRDAAFYLARLRTEGARETLVRALSDPDVERAEVATAALGWSDDPEAIAALAGRLLEDPDPAVRDLAARGLNLAAPASAAAKALTQAVIREQEEPVRLRALAGLAHCELASEPASRKAILDLLQSDTESTQARQAAIAALRAHHVLTRRLPVELQEALRRLVASAQGPVLLDAIALLGDVATDPATLEDALLKSSNPEVRAALEAALAALRNRVAPR